jgi:hypothetical protein
MLGLMISFTSPCAQQEYHPNARPLHTGYPWRGGDVSIAASCSINEQLHESDAEVLLTFEMIGGYGTCSL